MPKEYYNHNNTVFNKVYTNENELPRNVKVFIKELKNAGLGDELSFDRYEERTDLETNLTETDLDMRYPMDAEKNAKDEYKFVKEIEKNIDSLANALGIDIFYLSTPIINKQEFAEKFLTQFKKYLKSTEFASQIHSVRFDFKSTWNNEITIVLKRGFHRQWSAIHSAAKDYLNSLGYSKLKVNIP